MKHDEMVHDTDRIAYYAAVLHVAFYASAHPEFDVALSGLIAPGCDDPERFARDVNATLDRLG